MMRIPFPQPAPVGDAGWVTWHLVIFQILIPALIIVALGVIIYVVNSRRKRRLWLEREAAAAASGAADKYANLEQMPVMKS